MAIFFVFGRCSLIAVLRHPQRLRFSHQKVSDYLTATHRRRLGAEFGGSKKMFRGPNFFLRPKFSNGLLLGNNFPFERLKFLKTFLVIDRLLPVSTVLNLI